jgi:hypothetical protein
MWSKKLKIVCLSAVFLFLASLPVHGVELNLEQAKSRMISSALQGNVGQRAVFAYPNVVPRGTKIATWTEPTKVILDRDSWFFFVDEQPGANWEHKAQFVFVDKISGQVRAVPSQAPPLNLTAHVALNQMAERELSALRFNPSIIRAVAKMPKPLRLKQKKYAVMVSGGIDASYNYSRYWDDMAFIYKALKQKYGYTDDEIFVLYANGTHSPNEDFDGDGVDDVDYAATKANLTTVINYIAANIPSDGKFFFYSTNHGGSYGTNKSRLYLWGDSITDVEFAALTKNIKCAEAIYTMEQCYSGGMMDDILQAQPHPCSNPKVVVMTAASPQEVSWSCDTEGNCDEYVYYWTSAVFGKTPSGAVVNADMNGDGKVTMAEAHEYARSRDSRNEHPMIGSCNTDAANATLASKNLIAAPAGLRLP